MASFFLFKLLKRAIAAVFSVAAVADAGVEEEAGVVVVVLEALGVEIVDDVENLLINKRFFFACEGAWLRRSPGMVRD